jgi:ABC-type nickel/cobalt efflux system permease component RcnA
MLADNRWHWWQAWLDMGAMGIIIGLGLWIIYRTFNQFRFLR